MEKVGRRAALALGAMLAHAPLHNCLVGKQIDGSGQRQARVRSRSKAIALRQREDRRAGSLAAVAITPRSPVLRGERGAVSNGIRAEKRPGIAVSEGTIRRGWQLPV